ncbi:MAG: diaminopimelate decarboxylase [Caldiserica bacterium]|nr:MAG: diaminopimelate decarboxylase [Caldisericota bacterium]
MHYFNYKRGELFAEEVKVKDIAKKVPTPFYLYSKNTLIRHIRAFKSAFKEINPIICFALKSNSNFEILKILRNEGFGADCVSLFEMKKAIEAGFHPEKIVFNGNGKTEEELEFAIKLGILMINADNEEELELIDKICKKLKKRIKVSLRVNPEIDPKTHPHIATSLRESKFGFDLKKAFSIYRNASRFKFLELKGVHIHIGSQITDISPFKEALTKVFDFTTKLRKYGIRFEYFNAGGGLGIVYKKEIPPNLKEYAKVIMSYSRKIADKLILEPGRVIVGNAGILITKILYIKKSSCKKFIVVDAGMHGLLRPALYGAYHEVRLVSSRQKAESREKFDIVGPICESGDVLAKERFLPGNIKSGDLLAIFSAGAYGYVMSSNYNLRPLPAEVIVDGNRFKLIRRAQNYRDLRRLEVD